MIYSDLFDLSELIKISHKRHLTFNHIINWLINQFITNIEIFMSDLKLIYKNGSSSLDFGKSHVAAGWAGR